MPGHPPFDLLREAWLPVRIGSGETVGMRPGEALVRGDAVRPDWGRGDLDMAAFELLIGLAAVAACLTGENPAALYRDPPGEAWFDDAMAPVAEAFRLDGARFRFMQDLDPGAGWNVKPVEGLLIDAPGANTAKKGHDLFTRAGRVARLSPGAAAMALYALQSFAPSGGAGHRTSMRGGGPMTTLALPAPDAPLCAVVWANVPAADPVTDAGAVWPWLLPTPTSHKGETVTPETEGVHPLQAFFGMPRRIRLDLEDAPEGAVCDLTGAPLTRMVATYRTQNYGINYTGWVHPLTPHYTDKAGQILPLHPKPGRFAYGDWPGIVLADPGGRHRAQCVETHGRRARRGRAALLVAGWATDNMTALQYMEARTPLPVFDTPEREAAMAQQTGHLIDAADAARRALLSAVQAATVERPRASSGVAHDAAFRQGLADRFWAGTEGDFCAAFETMRVDVAETGGNALAIRRDWGHALRRHVLALFDDAVGMAELLRAGDVHRVVRARATLSKIMGGGVPKMNPVWKALNATPKETPVAEPA